MVDVIVYKYSLTDRNSLHRVSMPKEAKILSAQMQGRDLQLWALITEAADEVEREFLILGTGVPFVGPCSVKFIDTVQEGPFVWHVFEVLDD